jgi:membrane-associated phospholipid phosphatase
MATANHFWLDIAAGVVVALIAGAIVYRRQLRRALGRQPQVA